MKFTFKCLITKHPGITVVSTLVTSVLLLSYQLRIFEIIYYRAVGLIDFDQYFDSIWTVIITMATVGYGDLVPYS